MLNIDKQALPKSWIAHTSTPGATYTATSDLKQSLLDEQGHLCGYCMRRISLDTMQVEHWRAKSTHPNRQLEYQNLLATCPGGKGLPPKDQCCDSSKKSESLKYNPADPLHDVEAIVAYTGDGRITAKKDPLFDKQLDAVLHLNLAIHCNNRKKVRRAVINAMKRRKTWTKGQLARQLRQWRSRNTENMLGEYAGVAIYYLKKKLATSR